MTRRRTALLALPAAAVLLAGCGADDGTATAASPSCVDAPPTAQAPGSVSTDLATKPEVPADDAPPPCGLVVADVVVGDGAVVEAGSAVEVQYVGAFYGTGEEFDSSWSRGQQPLPFTAGEPGVIQGFGDGVVGMAEGGRRLITIPSDQGYGAAGQGPIPGGATLVFVVDLVSASGADHPAPGTARRRGERHDHRRPWPSVWSPSVGWNCPGSRRAPSSMPVSRDGCRCGHLRDGSAAPPGHGGPTASGPDGVARDRPQHGLDLHRRQVGVLGEHAGDQAGDDRGGEGVAGHGRSCSPPSQGTSTSMPGAPNSAGGVGLQSRSNGPVASVAGDGHHRGVLRRVGRTGHVVDRADQDNPGEGGLVGHLVEQPRTARACRWTGSG